MTTQQTAPTETHNILIVEDILSWQNTFKRYLKNTPFKVFVAGTPQEALILIAAHSFAIAIIDINLSGVPHNIDGLRLADTIWQKNKNTQFIIVSGINEPDRRLRTFDFEPACILEKRSLDQDEFTKEIYQAFEATRN